MRRREFLAATAAAIGPSLLRGSTSAAADEPSHSCGATYATPGDAQRSPPEKLLYATALYVGSDDRQPDYLATVDVDRDSPTYSQVVHRLPMPQPGDELHHFGWNACSSCHGDAEKSRRYLVLPGLLSGRIHIVDAADPARPKLHRIIEPAEIVSKTDLSAPHTVHCLPGGEIMLSMLGDGHGNAPGGFLLLDQDFQIAGRWENPRRP